MIALALPALDMPYFAELTRYVVQEAEQLGYTVLVDQTDGLRDREQVVATGVRSHLIDGLILSPVSMGYAELSRVDDEPLVLLGEKVGDGRHRPRRLGQRGRLPGRDRAPAVAGPPRVAAVGYQAGRRPVRCGRGPARRLRGGADRRRAAAGPA